MIAHTLRPTLGLALLGLAATAARADMPFAANYALTAQPPVPLSMTEAIETATASDPAAPYGLTSGSATNLLMLLNGTKSYTILPTSTFDFTDPVGDRIFGTDSGTGGLVGNMQVVNTTFVVTGGTGVFTGDTGGGTFTITEGAGGKGTLAVNGALVPAVPEPSPLGLLALGLLPAGLLARRRSKAV